MPYTPEQTRYIKSVDGNAHQSAVEIIGALEAALSELGGPKYFEEWQKQEASKKHV